MRVVLAVIDSFGIGALADAGAYGDGGANTALHIGQVLGSVQWPFLKKLGLGNASALLGNLIPGCEPVASPLASFAVMEEASPGKDTTTGHWELAGLVLERAFPVFPPTYPSFPRELTDRLTAMTGFEFLGNVAASGTQIIEELGEEHLRTKKPIIYTSGDSVFQIAAHDQVLPLNELYQLCQTARQLCDAHQVGRVIARPFTGSPGHFQRTPGRHDYSIALPGPTVLDYLKEKGILTTGVGKIGDIFNQQGLVRSFPEKGNPDCLAKTLDLCRSPENSDEFIFVNLVDTDMVYGHRRDVQGYHDCVAQVDKKLEELASLLGPQDLLVISADHGCDPSFRGSDHTREHVPLLVYRPGVPGASLGIRESFTDAAALVAGHFNLPWPRQG